jgi:hypothetical protein
MLSLNIFQIIKRCSSLPCFPYNSPSIGHFLVNLTRLLADSLSCPRGQYYAYDFFKQDAAFGTISQVANLQ